MFRLLIKLGFIFSTVFLVINCAYAAIEQESTTTTTTTTPTGTTVERKTIVTTVPAPKEAVGIPPSGFDRCFTVKAGWYKDVAGDVWAADHQVCQYANSPSGMVWVESYWVCSTYEVITGICTKWDWKPAHWENTHLFY